MTVRMIDPQAQQVSCAWRRRLNRLSTTAPIRRPEPTQLYALITLTFVLHKPERDGRCACCATRWPCEPVLLAYRLREGF